MRLILILLSTMALACVSGYTKEASRLLALANNMDHKIYLLENDKIIWDYPVHDNKDIHIMDNGDLMFTSGHKVMQVTRDKKIVFEHDFGTEVRSCLPLDNGNIMISLRLKPMIMEINRKGDVVKKIIVERRGTGMYLAMFLRMTPQNTLLLCVRSENRVVEYTRDGELISEFKVNCPHEAIRLENGHTLVSGGNSKLVTEFDNNGKIVWQLSPEDIPEINLWRWVAGIKKLKNGNVLICNWFHPKKGVSLFEVDRQKKVVWTYENKKIHSVSGISIR